MENNNNSAKFAFLYALSLVSLVILTIATGNVIFQVINKYISEVGELFSGTFSSSAIKFALASLIVAIPVYFLSLRKINSNLIKGDLDWQAGVRRWMTYFILLIASVVMIGWFIAVVFSFLEGELTIKFALKFLTVLVLAGGVFSYYLFDIKREGKADEKKIAKLYFWTALIMSLVVFVVGVSLAESPIKTRKARQDNEVINQLSRVESYIAQFYKKEDRLPKDLNELAEATFLPEKGILDPVLEEKFTYEIVSGEEYKICAEFQLSSTDSREGKEYSYLESDRWEHEVGKNCFEREALGVKDMPLDIREPIY